MIQQAPWPAEDLLAIWTDDAWPSTVHRVPLRGDGTPVTVAEHLAARLIGPKQQAPSAGTST